MMMARLNTRHELPQIATRQTQGWLEASIVQPRTRTAGNRQGSSNQGATQPPNLSIDNYPSRRAYGYRKHGDLAAERGQKGISDVQAATSRHSNEAWSKATTAARRGDDVVEKIRAEIFAEYEARVVFALNDIPDPEMQGYQSDVVGEPDSGDVTVDIETEPNARIHYTPGSVETFLQDEGFIRQWVSMNQYDTYA